MKTLLLACLLALLGGCATVDHNYSAHAQSSRVKFIVLHYTAIDLPQSIKVLTEQEVSAHYLLTDQDPPRLYGLVDETRQANHAGVSNWKDYTHLNLCSVGIEIVNPGYTDTPAGRVYAPFPPAQIARLMALVKDLMARHGVPPENVLGHSDIAPQRKQDPGPQFPWQQLAAAGLAVWPDAARVAIARAGFEPHVPDAAWFQQRLALVGYAVPQTGELDAATRNVVSVFQMRYRPALYDGAPDAETAAILHVLTTPATAAPVPISITPPVAK